jgi:hypothetical protein
LVRDNEAEELGLGLAERTLGKFHLEVGSTEGGEHLLDMPQVILLSFGEDDEVVQEGQAGDTDEGTEDVVHEAHKGGGGIGQSEREDGKFKATEASVEGGLVHVGWVEASLMIPSK